MKETYTNPTIVEVKLELEDIICVSLGANGDGVGGDYSGIFGK